jgi:hypothetical protein
VIVCTKCGEENQEGQTFCVAPGCGAYLVWAGSKAPMSAEQDPAVASVEPHGQAGTPVSAPVPSTPPSPGGTSSVAARRPEEAGARPSAPPPGGQVRGRREQVKVATRLAPTSLSVEPGAETSCQTMVHNTGTVVDEYTFEVTGQAAPWAVVEPPKLSLFPGAQGAVRIRFRPPRVSATPAGPLPFQVRTTSTTNHAVSTMEAGVLEVGAFTDLSAELTPHSSHGRRSGMHELRVRDGGNVPTPVQLSGKDPDAFLRFHLQPEALTVEPGAGGEAHVRAKPHHLRWLGRPQPHPFQVTATPQRGVPLTRDGIMRHDPVIPSWVPPLLALVVAAVVALVLLLPKPASPTVARVDPALAVGSVGNLVVDGDDFAVERAAPTVAFAPSEGIVAKLTGASPTKLLLRLIVKPDAPAGDKDVTVTNASGKSARCARCFKVTPPPAHPPTITSIDPPQLLPGVSRQPVTINGTNFSTNPPPMVTFNPGGVTSVISPGPTATQIILSVSTDPTALRGIAASP